MQETAGDFLKKIFEKKIFHKVGIDFKVDETFTSLSMKNVMRGLHFQLHNPQAKLVKVISGRVWDVVVDLRTGGPTYRKWTAMELSSDNHIGIYIPAFFAHGFLTLEDNTVMLYQCDGKYDRASDSGIRCDDPAIGIEWPIDREKAICSERDYN